MEKLCENEDIDPTQLLTPNEIFDAVEIYDSTM